MLVVFQLSILLQNKTNSVTHMHGNMGWKMVWRWDCWVTVISSLVSSTNFYHCGMFVHAYYFITSCSAPPAGGSFRPIKPGPEWLSLASWRLYTSLLIFFSFGMTDTLCSVVTHTIDRPYMKKLLQVVRLRREHTGKVREDGRRNEFPLWLAIQLTGTNYPFCSSRVPHAY